MSEFSPTGTKVVRAVRATFFVPKSRLLQFGGEEVHDLADGLAFGDFGAGHEDQGLTSVTGIPASGTCTISGL